MKKTIIAIILLLFTMSTASAGTSESPDPGYLAEVVIKGGNKPGKPLKRKT